MKLISFTLHSSAHSPSVKNSLTAVGVPARTELTRLKSVFSPSIVQRTPPASSRMHLAAA